MSTLAEADFQDALRGVKRALRQYAEASDCVDITERELRRLAHAAVDVTITAVLQK